MTDTPFRLAYRVYLAASLSLLAVSCSTTDTDATGGAATGGVTSGEGTGGTGGSVSSGGAAGGAGGEPPCETEFTVAELSEPSFCASAGIAEIVRQRQGAACEGFRFDVVYPTTDGTTLEFTSTGSLTYLRDVYHVGFSESCETGLGRLPSSNSCADAACTVCRTDELPDYWPTDLPFCEE